MDLRLNKSSFLLNLIISFAQLTLHIFHLITPKLIQWFGLRLDNFIVSSMKISKSVQLRIIISFKIIHILLQVLLQLWNLFFYCEVLIFRERFLSDWLSFLDFFSNACSFFLYSFLLDCLGGTFGFRWDFKLAESFYGGESQYDVGLLGFGWW